MTDTHTLKNRAVDLDTLKGFKIDGKPASDEQIVALLGEIEYKGRLGVVKRRKIENVKIRRKKYRPVRTDAITAQAEDSEPVEVVEQVEQDIELPVEPVVETLTIAEQEQPEPVEAEPIVQVVEAEPESTMVVTHDIRERLLDALALAKAYVKDYRHRMADWISPEDAQNRSDAITTRCKVGRKRITHADWIAQPLAQKFLDNFELLDEYVCSKTKLMYRCRACGVVRKSTPYTLIRRSGCSGYCKRPTSY